MKDNKRNRWRNLLVRCALGAFVLASTVLIGCANPGDAEETQKPIDSTMDSVLNTEPNDSTDDLVGDVTQGDDASTDVDGDVQNPETDDQEGNVEPGTDETQSGTEGEGTTGSEPATDVPSTDVPVTDVPTTDTVDYPKLAYDKAGWGLVYGKDGAQARGNEKASTLAAYNAYFVGSDKEKVIYLTFDCGYENGNTDMILDALAEHDVKATFFITGHFVKTEQELVKRMVDEGHAVANHTNNHPDITKFTTKEELAEELDWVANKFKEVTGKELNMYFRPPEGKCYEEALKWSKEMGYATILWSVAHIDWYTDNQPEPEKALETVISRTHPGAIVLLHNTSSTNAAILSDLIAKWKEMGYTIEPLSYLVGY